MEQEIVDYIVKARRHGLAEFEIKQNLLNAGWDGTIVEEGFVFAKAAENRPASMGQGEHRQASIVQNAESSILPKQMFSGALQPQRQSLVQSTHSNITINEKTFQLEPKHGNLLKNKFFWIILTIFAAIGGAAYGYYAYFYTTPAKVLEAYLSAKKPLTSKANYEFSYSLNYQPDNASSSQPVTLSVTGDSYSNFASFSGPEGSGNVALSGKFGSDSAQTSFKYLLLNNIIYFYVGDIKKAAGITDQYADWLKLDLGQAQKALMSNSGQSSTSPLLENPALAAKIKAIVEKAQIIKTTNYLAKEQINGTETYHIQNQLDTDALNKLVSDVIDAIQSDPSFTGTKITDGQKNIFASAISRFKVKNFDLWIGQKDHLLYKIYIITNFPSFSDIVKSSLIDITPLGAAQEKSREAKRLADVRQMAAALQLYYNDHGGYPEGITGKAQNITPKYITFWPDAPMPADGTCTDYFNSYWYKSQGLPKIVNGTKLYQSYTLTFCLGSALGGYKSGIGQLTGQGVKDNIACPATPDLCVSNKTKASESDIQNAVNKIGFNDEIKINITYSDYGTAEKLEAPANSEDILDLIKNLFGSIGALNQSRASQNP